MTNEAWIELSESEENKLWDKIFTDFGFNPSVHPDNFPGFSEPAPSTTYSITNIYDNPQNFSRLNRNLHESFLRIFKKTVPLGGFLYVLDWQHQCYKFFPNNLTNSFIAEDWTVPILPDGDYYLFLSNNLKYGTLGHPWEETICVFGEKLTYEIKHERPEIFRNPVRKRELL